MFDEDFKINVPNILLLFFTIVVLIFLILVSISAIQSLSKPIEDLPDLEITRGRTSTISKKTTTTTTTTTMKVTTTRKPGSPYYDIDVNSLLNEEILKKDSILRADAEEIMKILYEYANKFYNLADNSLIDAEYTLNHVLDGDKDVLVHEGNRYVRIYDGKSLIDKLISIDYHYMLVHIKYRDYNIILKEGNEYYRLENKLDDAYPIIASVSVKKFNSSEIEGIVRYYMSDYIEKGHTSPIYKESDITLVFEDGRWKIKSYIFPSYER